MRSRPSSSLAVLAAVLATTAPAAGDGARRPDVTHALIVGNNLPPPGEALRPLRYADDDALRFTGLFESLGASVTLLTVLDAASQARYASVPARAIPPTLAEFTKAVRAIRAAVDRDLARGNHPEVVITFSGHGGTAADGEGYLAFHDGTLSRSVWTTEVLDRFRDVPLHMIIDSCHAGSVVGLRGPFDREVNASLERSSPPPADAWLGARPLSAYPLAGALVSSAPEQEAHEWSRVESGVFTHEVVSGLRGAADIDGNLEVEYSELRAFVAAANRDLPDPRARPTIVAHTPASDGRAVLTRLRRLEGARLLRGSGRIGHFYVERTDGQRVLEAHLSPSQTVQVVIDAGQGAYLRTVSEEAFIAPGTSAVDIADLTFRPKETSARGSVASSLESHLFRTPYGRPYYLGFVDSYGLSGVPFDAPVAATADAPRTGNATLAWTFAGVAGAALVTSAITGYLALDARAEFDRADTPRAASEYEADYQRYGTISLTTGVAGVASAVAAVILWPRAAESVTVGVHPGPSVSWRATW